MSCLINEGIAKGCRDNIGGVQSVFIANIELLSAITFSAETNMIETISTKSIAGSAAPAFYEFQVNKNSSKWTDNGGKVASNGGTFYTPTVVMVFSKNDAAKANTVKLMGQSTLIAIVKMNDGKYFLLGSTPASAVAGSTQLGNGLEIDTSVFDSGTAYADLNGWTITLSGGESYPAFEIPAALVTASIVVVV